MKSHEERNVWENKHAASEGKASREQGDGGRGDEGQKYEAG